MSGYISRIAFTVEGIGHGIIENWKGELYTFSESLPVYDAEVFAMNQETRFIIGYEKYRYFLCIPKYGVCINDWNPEQTDAVTLSLLAARVPYIDACTIACGANALSELAEMTETEEFIDRDFCTAPSIGDDEIVFEMDSAGCGQRDFSKAIDESLPFV